MQNLLNLKRIVLSVMSVAVDVTAISKPSEQKHFVQIRSANYHYKITNLDLDFISNTALRRGFTKSVGK